MTDFAGSAHGAIVLAAGASRRLGQPKQLLRIGGETLLHRAARLALATTPQDCVVVLGAGYERMADVLADLPLRLAVCADYRSGMAASLHTGLGALSAACAGALVLLTDQPALDAAHLLALCECWRARPSGAVASGYAGVVGVPALLPRSWFAELSGLDGDHGARDLLRAHAADVRVLPAPALARDIDRPPDAIRFR